MKASGSTSSLLQGVSQQVPSDRGPGQHTEQINMLPDPVQGLSRRHGSKWVAERQLTNSPSLIAAYTADTDNWRTFEYSNAGHDYVVLSRKAARPAGSTLPVLIVYDRTTKAFLPLTRNVTDAQLDLLETGGISGMTAIGKYVFMSGFTTPATATSVDLLNAGTNPNDAVVWVRGGAYARTYTVVATRTDGTQFTFSYKTPTSSYPGTLDTRGVPIYAADPAGGTTTDTESAYITLIGGIYRHDLQWKDWTPTALTVKKGSTAMTNVSPAAPASSTEFAWAAGTNFVQFHISNLGALDVSVTYTHIKTITNPNYSKIVGDMTNAFNTAVTNWIGSAADAIQPAAIAEQLKLAAIAAGLATASRQAGTVIFDNVKALSVNDGGDGTLIRGVANEVTGVDEVSDIHKIGKIVKVRARNAAEAFYLVAQSKSAGITSGYAEVTWVEGVGTQHTITNALCFLTVSAGTAYLASSKALLLAILPSDTLPVYSQSTVGDVDSSPLPFFIGKQITYLGVFQDRLVIGAGAVVRCSKIGDYMNFFRSSILTAPADDPLEMLSQGSEDDVLRYSIIYDRDLVIFADKRQYAISGRIALTPTSANMQVMSSHVNASQMPPRAVGSVIFYGQLGEVGSAVFQVQPGLVVESPESYIQSSQIDTYLGGAIIELAANAKPTHLFARTTGSRNTVFCFTYLDKAQQGRVQDAWHRLDYNAALGPIIGMSQSPDGLLIYSLRVALDHGGVSRTYVVADLQPMTTGLATYPYLDSLRTLALVNANAGSLHSTSTGPYRVAFDGTSQWRFVGSDLSDQAGLLAEFPTATGPQVGIDMATAFTPTNPFIRDRNDKVINSGKLVIATITASIAKSSGFFADVVSEGRETTETFEYNARIVGSPDDLVGRETVTDMIQTQPIALETSDYTLTLRARKWLPFTITTLQWVGQWFNRTQRF